MNRVVALVILTIIGPIFGYLCGSLLWSIIIGKLFFKTDVRKLESQNAGATNSSRVFGKQVGIIILILDVLKSLIPTITISLITTNVLKDYLNENINNYNEYSLIYLTSVCALLGHCYPIFFKFKGGKGVSCFGAMLISISPFVSLLSLIIFISIIIIFKYVSLGSIVGVIIAPLMLFIPGLNWLYLLNQDISSLNIVNNLSNLYTIVFIFGLLVVSATIIIIKHRSNINRLINHEERKINKSKNSYKKFK